MSGWPVRRAAHSTHAGAVQQRRHLEPCPGEGMGEAVDQRFRIGAVAVGRDEDLRRGAERDEGVAAIDGADADGAGCGVSALLPLR